MSSNKFYTNCTCIGNNILYRGYNDGERERSKFTIAPKLFVPVKKETKWKTLDGSFVDKIEFLDINDAKDFVKRYENVDNYVYYGNTKYQYVHLCDEYPNQVEYDFSKLVIANIDIEVSSEAGFAPVENPYEQVIAITVESKGRYCVFGCGEFTIPAEHKNTSIKFFRCSSERDLLEKFMNYWEELSPDIVTGWNIKFYDIPYLVNRITKVFGEKDAKRLSPWRYLTTKKDFYKGRDQLSVELVGISTLDYMEMYRKFQPKTESEKLNYIAHIELGEKKLSYEEYGSLHSLYKNNFQKFIEYNIKDVELIKKLEEKLKLIEMCVSLAYDAKVNFSDVFYQVRMWDNIIYNHLKQKNIVIPRITRNTKDSDYAGAYVKDVVPGMYDWVVSFDLNSLYPNLIAQFNISPECLSSNKFKSVTVRNILDKQIDTKNLIDDNISLAANGQCFDNSRLGFFPEILMRMYEDRKLYKNKMLESQKELERVKQEITRRRL
jgi:DNA polymerase elongation subunit (family B)